MPSQNEFPGEPTETVTISLSVKVQVSALHREDAAVRERHYLRRLLERHGYEPEFREELTAWSIAAIEVAVKDLVDKKLAGTRGHESGASLLDTLGKARAISVQTAGETAGQYCRRVSGG